MNGRSRPIDCSCLGLGTVQFGLDYGVTNSKGKVAADAVTAILDHATASGIRLLDTAFLYGDSETVIGKSGRQSDFEIVTKTDRVAGSSNPAAAADRVERGFDQSLARLACGEVYGLLVHDANDLLGPNADAVWRRLSDLRDSGRARKIGVSVYDGREIDMILDRFDIDLVQLPFSALDRRLVDGGQLAALAARNVEVHARSIFLQGLLLEPPEKLPPSHAPLRPVVAEMRRHFTDAGLTVMEGLIASALYCQEIGRVIVGTTSLRDLEEITAATLRVGRRGGVPGEALQAGRWSVTDRRLLNPAMWNML